MTEKQEPISFEVAEEQVRAIEALAGDRKVRLSGEVRSGRLVVDSLSFADQAFSEALFVPVNAPFKAVQTSSS
jgi:hypothetical protein